MKDAKYFVREAQMAWQPCKAETLREAKRAALREALWLGTDVWVGVRIDGVVEPLAVKRADARRKQRVNGWVDVPGVPVSFIVDGYEVQS